MAETNPGAIGLAVKLPFATPEEFVSKYGNNITLGGIFLRAKGVKPPGTSANLELRLTSGARLIYAAAVVHFVTGQAGEGVSGMGLRFLTLDAESQRFLDTMVAPLPHARSPFPPVPQGVGPVDYGAGPAPTALQPAAAAPAAPQAPPASAAPALTAPAFVEPTEEPRRGGPIIGIDLGTTNSCASFVRNGKAEVLRSREGYNTVPSIIALTPKGRVVVGHPAKSQMLTNPRLTVYGAKRLVGRPYESQVVQQIKDRFHYEISAGESGEAAVRLADRVYSLQQISAMILREVREGAQNQLGQPVSRAVVTVPAYYNDNQRQAVRESGRLAGLHVERILNEPTAAALSYGFGRNLQQKILVYDLGGGTFDASVLELSSNVYEVISTGGDTFLGGIDFDNAIVEHLLEEFKAKTGKVFNGDRIAMQRVTEAAERAKCALSERSEMRIHVPFITVVDGQPYDLDITLTRERLVQLTDKLVDRTLQVCDEVLRAKNLTPRDIDEVILVGGQSRFPLVHEKITRYFGKPPSKGAHPDEAVANGAALLAHSLGQLEGVVLIDVLPMSIGIGLPGGKFKPVMDRNSPLPSTRNYVIATARDNQTEVDVSVFQGDSDKTIENEYLGTMSLSGLSKGARGAVSVEVSFEVSSECLLRVTAKEVATGREISSTFSMKKNVQQARARAGSVGEHAPQPPPPAGAPPRRAAEHVPMPAQSAGAVPRHAGESAPVLAPQPAEPLRHTGENAPVLAPQPAAEPLRHTGENAPVLMPQPAAEPPRHTGENAPVLVPQAASASVGMPAVPTLSPVQEAAESQRLSVPPGTPAPEVVDAASRPGGLLGWFKRLFGRR